MSTPSATSGAARKDDAHIDRDWTIERRLIDGVQARDVRNIVTANGITTELYRPDWGIVQGTVQQVIHVALRGSAVSAWHQHRQRWDFLFVVGGHLRVVLYDPRDGSPTRRTGGRVPPQPGEADAALRCRPGSGTAFRISRPTSRVSSTCSIVLMTTPIRTSGAFRSRPTSFPTGSPSECRPHALDERCRARAPRRSWPASNAVGVDLEHLGKSARQRGRGHLDLAAHRTRPPLDRGGLASSAALRTRQPDQRRQRSRD